MKKKVFNLKNAKVLTKDQQKSLNGGRNPFAGCANKPCGANCFYGGHSGCPGCCDCNGNCIPY